MAISDRNILITPNVSATGPAQPSIVFTGADSSIGDSAAITLTARPENSGTLSFTGDAGQLFSITNDLSGTLFAVSDISGIPSLEIHENGIVKLAEYSGRVLVGTDSDDSSSSLQIDGDVRATSFIGDGSNVTSVDAETLDGLDNTSFLRSDAADTKTSGDLTFSDNVKAVFGTGSDLEIYHDGSNSIINDAGTGYLTVQGAALGNTAGDVSEILSLQNTNSNTNRLRIFSERDVDGSDWTTAYTRIQQIIDVTEMSYIQFNGDGKQYGMEFGTAGDELYQKNVRNGQVELYYNNSKKFETTSAGATVTGTMTATAFSGDGSALTGISAGVSDGIFLEYNKSVTSNYTIDNGVTALTASNDSDGISITSGVTVTISDSSGWVITGGDKNMGLDAMVATSNQTERTMRTGTINPTLDNTYDLGDSAVGWRDIYSAGTVTATTFSGGGLGKILQVKFADKTGSDFSTSNSSFTDAGLSLSITPTSSSSKIFVLFHGEGGQDTSGRSCFYRVLRGATEIGLQDNLQTGTTSSQMPMIVTQLDSPATTSATTYKVQMRTDGVGTVTMIGSNRSHITLFEVAS